MERLIYLDNAATSYPKPPEVLGEVIRSFINYGGNPGRGTHKLSLLASEKIYECRETAARLFGVSDPSRIFFTLNATQGLNTVIKGLLRQGDHVLISDIEHNAVYRPIYKLAESGRITFDIFKSFCHDPERSAAKICADVAQKLRKNTRLVISTGQSNILSLTMPVREIADLCKRNKIYFLVDGAGIAGHEDIDLDATGISALCLPSHKGLYGPQGCGMVLLGKGVFLSTLTEGGNGIDSLGGKMPDFSPERYEAGTLPTPAIAGLCEGMKFVSSVGTSTISRRERELFIMAREYLSDIKSIKIHLPQYEGSILLFSMNGVHSDKIGELLGEEGICVRSGYHCTALAHKTLGTVKDGAVRVSFGAFNDPDDVKQLADVLTRISKNTII